MFNYPRNIICADCLFSLDIYLRLNGALAHDYKNNRDFNSIGNDCILHLKSLLNKLIIPKYKLGQERKEILKSIWKTLFDYLGHEVINESALSLELLMELKQEKPEIITTISKELCKKRPNTLAFYVYSLFDRYNKRSLTYSEIMRLCQLKSKLLDDHQHKTIHIGPFSAVGVGHIWPLIISIMHKRSCKENSLAKNITLWTDSECSINSFLEGLLVASGEISYMGKGEVVNVNDNLFYDYYETMYFYDVRFGVPNLEEWTTIDSSVIRDFSNLLGTMNLPIDSPQLIDKNISHIPIHIRTSDFKPDNVVQQAYRNTNPEDLKVLVENIKEQGDHPSLLCGGTTTKNVPMNLNVHVANDRDSYKDQIEMIRTSKYMVGSQSGASHLWVVGAKSLFLLNMCSCWLSSPIPVKHLVLCKRPRLNDGANLPKTGKMIQLLLGDWVDPEFLFYFNLQDNTDLEISTAFNEFLRLNKKNRKTLEMLFKPYEELNVFNGNIIPKRNLASSTYYLIEKLLKLTSN